MKQWQGIVVFVWVEVIALAIASAHFVAYRDPSRNRMTRFVAKYWEYWVAHPVFGVSVFRSARAAMLFQACLAFGLGLFFLIVLAVGGFR